MELCDAWHGHVILIDNSRTEPDRLSWRPLSYEWEDSGMERFLGSKEALEFKTHHFEPSDVAM
jgi:hypothetical protein